MRHRVLPLFLAPLLVLGACTGDAASDDTDVIDTDTTADSDTTDATTVTGADIDARSYYDDYEESHVEMSAGSPTKAGEDGAAPQPRAGGAEASVAPIDETEGDWPEPTEDNVFVDSGDSTFTATADDAESTFALDVDTGSYRVGLAQLEEGVLPEPSSIRPEEWINAFEYDDPAPTNGDALGVTVETNAALHALDGTQLVRIGVATAEATERPPANITFVIDTSGSMDIRDRLGLVQSSLALLVQHLQADDSIAIVTYGDNATPVLPPTKVADAERIIGAIDELGPGGSTNMEAGLLLGYDQAREAFDPAAVNVVVLASDGVANVGVTDATVLTDQITQAGEDGIHLVTVGYGMGNYNDHLMEQLADQGDGFYSYVNTFEEAERLFVEDLTATLTVVAGDAKAQVRFDPAAVSSYRLIGYENRGLDDSEFRDDTVDAGELGAGHAVTALYEVQPAIDTASHPDGAPAIESFGTVTLRWTTPGTTETTERSIEIPANSQGTSSSFRLAAAVAELAEVLRDSPVMDERGTTLDDVKADVDALVASDVPGADELDDVVDLARAVD